MQPPNLDLTQLLSDKGQTVLLEWFRAYRDQHGHEWREQIKAEWPLGAWVVELVTTRTADEAFTEIVHHYPVAFFAGRPIKALHARFLEEIDKKR